MEKEFSIRELFICSIEEIKDNCYDYSNNIIYSYVILKYIMVLKNAVLYLLFELFLYLKYDSLKARLFII